MHRKYGRRELQKEREGKARGRRHIDKGRRLRKGGDRVSVFSLVSFYS